MVHVEGKDDRMVANNLEPHYLTHPGRGDKGRVRVSWHQSATLGCRDWSACQSAERSAER